MIFARMLIAAALALCASVSFASNDRIVAVVNDQVITLSQLTARAALNSRQLGMTNSTDVQQNAVIKRTLSGMIDEELQRQYADSNNIKISPQDMEMGTQSAMAAIGGADKWQALTKGLEGTAKDKVTAEVRWQKIMAHDIKPRIVIGTTEVDRLITELAKSRHVLEREISVIMLSPGENEADKGQLDKIKDIKAKVTKGEDFDQLARAFSEDKSAVNGGNMGWFAGGELNPQLEEALDKMQPGQVSEPIRTPVGWYLVKLDNVRTTKPVETEPITQFDLYMLAVTTPADDKGAKAVDKALSKQTKDLDKVSEVQSYFEKAGYAKDFAQSSALGWVAPGDLQTEIQNALKGLKPGKWTDTVKVGPNSVRLFVADTRQTLPEKLQAYRQKVMDSLYGNRLELESRRFMQDLRQRAFVDVRL